MDPDDVISSQSSASSSPTKSKLGATSYPETASSSGCSSSRYSRSFLSTIQKAADRHLQEKNEIRDALSLLKIYHRASSAPAAGATAARGAAGADRATGRDDTDASRQKKAKKMAAKKMAAKSEENVDKSDDGSGSGGAMTRASLAVAKSKPGSAEASPNKRRKNSDFSKWELFLKLRFFKSTS